LLQFLHAGDTEQEVSGRFFVISQAVKAAIAPRISILPPVLMNSSRFIYFNFVYNYSAGFLN
jgi:hypothetical protein